VSDIPINIHNNWPSHQATTCYSKEKGNRRPHNIFKLIILILRYHPGWWLAGTMETAPLALYCSGTAAASPGNGWIFTAQGAVKRW